MKKVLTVVGILLGLWSMYFILGMMSTIPGHRNEQVVTLFSVGEIVWIVVFGICMRIADDIRRPLRRIFGVLLTVWSVLLVVVLTGGTPNDENGKMWITVVVIEVILFFGYLIAVRACKDPVEREEARIERMERRSEKAYQRELRRRPVAAVLIGTEDGSTKALAGSMLGYAALGPVGAAVGMVGAKSRAIFSVKYADGHTGTETVTVGSDRFNELAALLLE